MHIPAVKSLPDSLPNSLESKDGVNSVKFLPTYCYSIPSNFIPLVAHILASEDSNPQDDRKTLLIGGMFPMSGGWAGGIGCRPAIDLALHDVNNNPNVLRDYKLELVPVDSQVRQQLQYFNIM